MKKLLLLLILVPTVIIAQDSDFDIYYNVEITHLSNPNVNREDWEIDFIIFNEKMGFLVIEVKGGNPIDYIPSEDKWYSTTRHGNKNEIKNPPRQARQNKYAILEKVFSSVVETRLSSIKTRA